MGFSIYDASVPVFQRNIRVVQSLLAKAGQHVARNGLAEADLLQAKLADDMLPLVKQVQIVSDAAKGGAFRLADQTPPSFEDNETTFASLHDRLGRTLQALASLNPADFAGREDATIAFKMRDREFSFTGRDFLNQFAMPNFYFHVVTTYAILRHKGVTLGKPDFLGAQLDRE